MNINSTERKRIIDDLQKLALHVRSLKEERRQKHPIVIEFSGSPKAGKTSCINSLELFLKRNGFSVRIVQERASVCPVTNKQSPMFNIWTACTSLASLIGTLENKNNQVDVLILDRGIFDALCWFDWLVSSGKMEEEQREIAGEFLLMEDIVKRIDIVFSFCAEPKVSIEREYATLLTDKPGTIMNEKVLNEYLQSVDRVIESKKGYFHSVFKIDTTNKNQDEVGKEVTENTLNTLKNLLMERVGYFNKSDEFNKLLLSKDVIEYSEIIRSLPNLNFELREKVEKNPNWLQPIPVAIITNKSKDKILVIKKNKSAASQNSPEREKLLVYIGGHSRFEDKTDINSKDFLTVCRKTLKREVDEEIGISVALNNIKPFFIYSDEVDTSKNHLAVCFLIPLDDDGVKLRLDSQELVLTKGRSKSGKFLAFDEIQSSDIEEWSKRILKYCFDIDLGNDSGKQLTLFN